MECHSYQCTNVINCTHHVTDRIEPLTHHKQPACNQRHSSLTMTKISTQKPLRNTDKTLPHLVNHGFELAIVVTWHQSTLCDKEWQKIPSSDTQRQLTQLHYCSQYDQETKPSLLHTQQWEQCIGLHTTRHTYIHLDANTNVSIELHTYTFLGESQLTIIRPYCSRLEFD